MQRPWAGRNLGAQGTARRPGVAGGCDGGRWQERKSLVTNGIICPEDFTLHSEGDRSPGRVQNAMLVRSVFSPSALPLFHSFDKHELSTYCVSSLLWALGTQRWTENQMLPTCLVTYKPLHPSGRPKRPGASQCAEQETRLRAVAVLPEGTAGCCSGGRGHPKSASPPS